MSLIVNTPTPIVLAFALATAVMGCSKNNNGESMPAMVTPASTDITITGMNGNMSFSPAAASVRVGQSVQWHNADSTTHAIAEDMAGGFTTGAISPGATSSSVTISTAGAHPYHCTIHPSMTGSVIGQ